MITVNRTPFEEVADLLSGALPVLSEVPRSISDRARELRLRVGQPPVADCGAEKIRLGTTKITRMNIAECIRAFCDYSIYSFEKELSEGFITLRGGHRAGICGTAVIHGGKIETIKDISSVSVRIAREFRGCADELFQRVYQSGELKGLLIIGKPLSGKTTVLRDLVRLLGADYKVAVIDERGEIAAMYDGAPQNDIGQNTDVLNGYDKRTGIIQAVRTLSPDIIVCDEIGDDAESAGECLNRGVGTIFTAHCSGITELENSPQLSALLMTGAIEYVALLGTGRGIGRLMGIWRVSTGGEADAENISRSAKRGYWTCGRTLFFCEA